MRFNQGIRKVIDAPFPQSWLVVCGFLFSMATGMAVAPKPSYGFTAAAEPANIFSRYTVLSDINGDGIIDIVSVDNAGILVTPGNGDGTYQPPIRTTLTDPANAFVVADLDGDGRKDLIVYSGPAFSVQSLTVFLGLGNGGFRVSGKITLPASASSRNLAGADPIALADFDGNGLPDIALNGSGISNGIAVDKVSVWLNQGGGTFGTPVTFPTGTNPGSSASLIVVGDFNNDGNPDIASASSLGRMAVIFGDGKGAFGAPLTFTANLGNAVQLTNLAVSDLNGDGKLDLVTAQTWIGVPADASVGVYMGHGDGTFASGVLYRPSVIDVYGLVTVYPGTLQFADLTGDGILDLVASNYRVSSFGEVIVYPGNGDGTFEPASIYQTTSQANFVAAADLNSDGRMDLVVTSPSTSGQLSAIQVLNGSSGPYLRLVISNNGPVYLDEDTLFSVNVVNLGDAPTNGTVVLRPGSQVSAAGWNCGFVDVGGNYAPQCSRDEILAPGASYPPFPVTVTKPTRGSPSYDASLYEAVWGGGSARSDRRSAAKVIPLNSRCPFVFSNGNTDGIIQKQTTVSRLGGSFFLTLGLDSGCPWSVGSDAAWLTAPTPATPQYIVAPNSTGVKRTATLRFSSITGWSDALTIVQSGDQCLYSIAPSGFTFSSQGGETAYYANVESGCPIQLTVNVPWLTVTGTAVRAAANTTGSMRQGTISVGNVSTSVFQAASLQGPAQSGSMAHFAVGGGWETTFQIVNASSNVKRASLSTFRNSVFEGLGVPAYVDDENFYTSTFSYAINRVLPAHATVGIHSAAAGSALPTVGSANLQFDPGVGAFARFRYVPNGQEAMVPMETRAAKSFTLGFDNTNGITTGIAISAQSYNTDPSGTVAVTIRDDAGNVIDSASVSMQAGAHDSYLLSDRFPKTAGKAGTIQFATAAAGQISVIGLRSPPSLRFSTIPPVSEIDPGNGTISQLAVGGGWSTTVEVINTTAAPAPAQLTFAASDGTPLILPLSVSGTTTNSSQLQQTLPPNGRLVVNISGSDSAAVQIGSAHLTSGIGVSGFVRYSYAPLGQDAIVPLETRQAASYVFAFDNTEGAGTGVAVANSGSTAVTIPVTAYDASGIPLATTTVALPAHGQTAFMLGDRIRATLDTRGSVQFTTPAGGTISVLGLRYPGSGAFTTIPVMTPP